MTRSAIKTTAAPGAVGPYSQAIDTGTLVFLAGQAERVMRNLTAVLDAAGLTFDDVAKTTCFLADMADFEAFNKVYARFVTDPPPARSTFAVAALPRGALVEIEA